MKETRVYATLVAEDINVETFEPSYNEQEKRYPMPAPVPISLRSGGSRIPPASPSAPSRQIARRPNVERPGQIDKSAPGSSKKA